MQALCEIGSINTYYVERKIKAHLLKCEFK